MVKVALFVQLEAKPGKEADVENFLLGGLPIVEEEPATTAWFAIRMGPSTFRKVSRSRSNWTVSFSPNSIHHFGNLFRHLL